MSKIHTSLFIDDKLFNDSSKLFNSLGMDFSTAVKLFLKQTVFEEKLPFIPSDIPNETTIQAINEIENMIKNPTEYKSYSTVWELIDDLNNDSEE